MQAMSHMANFVPLETGSQAIKLISQGILLITQVQAAVILYFPFFPLKG